MNLNRLPYEYMNKYGPLTWREIEWGIKHELIGWDVVKDMAIERMSSESDQSNELVILNTNDPMDLIGAVRNLASSEPEEIEIEMRSKWLKIVLANLFLHKVEVGDPLAEVERIYADFDYPEEIESFVRYMPCLLYTSRCV